MKIEICVGSSCHLKGAHQVVQAFQNEISKYGLENHSELKLTGSFCHNACTNGVIVKIDEQLFTQVTPAKARELFEQWVLGGLS
ncbi:MAG: (2Fe-2S) ferredoxin domain-containing protein [Peptococcaceae bacterium]